MSTVKPDTQSATAADVRLQTVTGRIPVTDVQPVVLDGRFPAKAVVGEDIPVRATVFREGHDSVRATVRLLDPAGAEVQRVQMRPGRPGLDEVVATLRPAEPGLHQFVVEGWDDPVGTWKHAATVKIAAGVDVELMLAEGAALFRAAAEDAERSAQDRAAFEEAARVLGASGWQTFWRVTLPNIRWALLYGAVLCTARAVGEFGGVSVVSGAIRGQTNTLPLQIELLFNDLNIVGAFAAASTLTLIALVVLVLKDAIAHATAQLFPQSRCISGQQF